MIEINRLRERENRKKRKEKSGLCSNRKPVKRSTSIDSKNRTIFTPEAEHPLPVSRLVQSRILVQCARKKIHTKN